MIYVRKLPESILSEFIKTDNAKNKITPIANIEIKGDIFLRTVIIILNPSVILHYAIIFYYF